MDDETLKLVLPLYFAFFTLLIKELFACFNKIKKSTCCGHRFFSIDREEENV